jgi:hypothetical protein
MVNSVTVQTFRIICGKGTFQVQYHPMNDDGRALTRKPITAQLWCLRLILVGVMITVVHASSVRTK